MLKPEQCLHYITQQEVRDVLSRVASDAGGDALGRHPIDIAVAMADAVHAAGVTIAAMRDLGLVKVADQ